MTQARLPVLSRLVERVFSGGASALFILGARLLQNANGFLLTAVVAHFYGLGAVGTLTLATVPTTLVAIFGTFGLHFRFAQIKASNAACNSLGLFSAAISLPVVLVVAVAFGFAFGHDAEEQFNLAVLAFSSPFFAQTSVTSALQVLQRREAQSIISPALNAIGLLVGALTPDFSSFCLSVLAFRLAGIVVPYALLPHDFTVIRQAAVHLRAGMRYLLSDVVLVLSENFILLLSSGILSRSELGILGICRQLLTASDTPGWANIQSLYPRLVAGSDQFFQSTTKSMLRLGTILGALVTIVAIPAGILVFKAPDLWIYAAILMASVPARYVVLTIETYLKAKGEIGFVTRLTALRALAALATVYTATALGGLLGHVMSLSAFFIVVAMIEFALVPRNGVARFSFSPRGGTQ
ncbi:hypothetical protein [Sinorhizobium sp. BG8]|uniref:hypothetical protein n=1 Tax=Sinorhizobium sp. BG8 TaxID=2613773 RepID=UPI00193DBCB5|nr:hypothetical protein [Sinorhizobium sp. BG8]QRM53584.1 hypothetical protein F3Y30_02635 [Sinorhizobium sp. BG8]